MKVEDNILLTSTDPGTPMGRLFRRYWIPALMSDELPRAGGQPRRVELLGEKLVAYRSGNGTLGLVQEACGHRLASLAFGKCDIDGIRCSFHGWKYNAEGKVIDTPNEPATSTFKDRIQIKAYPVREHGGVIWAYMGEPELQPELPDFEWAAVHEGQRFVSKRLQACNYLQAFEGGIDASHVSMLHADARAFEPVAEEDFDDNFADISPKFHVSPTDYGILVVAERTRPDELKYCRVTQVVLPWYTMIAPVEKGLIGGHAFVPKNDRESWVWSVDYHPERMLTHQEISHFRQGGGIHSEVDSVTFVPVRNTSNEYLRNPYLQNMGSMTGIVGIANQDAAMQESMGPIVDRTEEHLGASDAGIIIMRRKLRALALQIDTLEDLPGLDPVNHRVRSAAIVLDEGQQWVDVAYSLGMTEPRTLPKVSLS